uniref:Uncharacterized protein n=1 Tax=Anguilla anguilla TaxID=7936 RepID=A0A0E9WMW0_ANGAN
MYQVNAHKEHLKLEVARVLRQTGSTFYWWLVQNHQCYQTEGTRK